MPDDTQYTPGPWTAQADAEGFWIGNRGENAARVYGYTDHPRNIANADLVAAAPEMLAALKDAIPALERAHSLAPGGPRKSDALGRLQRARAVIAKSEGR